jgi:hypothetical protein
LQKESELKAKPDTKTVRGQFQFGECCNASWARDLKFLESLILRE